MKSKHQIGAVVPNWIRLVAQIWDSDPNHGPDFRFFKIVKKWWISLCSFAPKLFKADVRVKRSFTAALGSKFNNNFKNYRILHNSTKTSLMWFFRLHWTKQHISYAWLYMSYLYTRTSSRLRRAVIYRLTNTIKCFNYYSYWFIDHPFDLLSSMLMRKYL